MEQESYESPIIVLLGTLEEVRGSGGNEADGCSSGHYQNDDDE